MKKLVIVIVMFLCLMLQFPAFAVEGIWANPKGIKVYIPPKDNLSLTMRHAFNEWQRKTNNYFTFKHDGTVKSTAQIEVVFMESGIPEICMQKTALGCTRTMTTKSHLGERIKHATVYISRKSNTGRVMSNTQVYTIMLHEIGHALGLDHTSNPKSIMYSGTNQSMAVKQEIQVSDLNILYNLYHSDKQHKKDK